MKYIRVKTPGQAIEKCLPRSLPRSEAYWGKAYWGFDMKPEIIKQKPWN